MNTIMLKEIKSIDEIKLMVDTFYDSINKDELLSPIFNDIAGVNWELHLPKMYGFWNSILFGTGEYKGQPFPPHLKLPINQTHFDRWIELFNKTIDDLFIGEKAVEVKMRAATIARVFSSKITMLKNQ